MIKRNVSNNELHVIYTIDEGSRHKLAKVFITGSISDNRGFPVEDLLSRMQVQPAGKLLSHGRYSQALLTNDIRGFEDLYKANGFQQVKITSNVQDDYKGEKNQIAAFIKIEPGPLTLVHDFQVVGNEKASVEQFPLNIVVGQPFSESKVADDRDIILNYYFNHGFPDATFEATAKSAAGLANQMDVTFNIHEGRQVFVDHVLVTGLNYTRPFVVQREILTKPGDPLSQLSLLKTQQSLYDLGIFSQVDTAVQNPDGSDPQKDVLVNVQEAKRYTFNYGVGLEFQTGQPAVGSNQPQGETGVSPRVSLDITRLNFRGRNHTITFKSHAGRLQQRALISYNAPAWFNSKNWTLSITTFYDNTLDVTTFTSERLEGSIQAEQTISKASTMFPASGW